MWGGSFGSSRNSGAGAPGRKIPATIFRLLSSSATYVVPFSMTGLLSPVALFRAGTIHDHAIGQAGPSILSSRGPLRQEAEQSRQRLEAERRLSKVLVPGRRAGDGDTEHAGGAGSQHPVAGVLHDETVLGRHCQPPRGLQEDIGGPLARGDLDTGDDRLECLEKQQARK